MHVEFRVPAMSTQGNPIRWTGKGSLEISEQGLNIQAFKKKGVLDGGCLIALAVVVGIFLMGVFGVILKEAGLGEGVIDLLVYGGAGAIGIAIFTLMRSRSKKEQKAGDSVDHHIAWSEVKKVYWDEMTRLLVISIKSKKVKGVLHIVEPNGSDLQLKLQECLKQAKAGA